MQIISIVPRLPPSINGVADYALNIARQINKDFGVKTKFIVGDNAWIGENYIEGFSTSKVSARSVTGIIEQLSINNQTPTTVLLHYVGYGYAKRGCPVWLIEGLERWKKQNNDSRLVTMFHEIYAFGPPWTSSFWLSHLQKNLAVRLIQTSNACITSRYNYAEIIRGFSNNKKLPVDVLPIFSTVGEPKYILPLAKRQKYLIIFGSKENKIRVYQNSFPLLQTLCQKMAIEKILDIGTPTNLPFNSVGKVPIEKIGELPAVEVSNILANSLAGFINYPANYLAKSSTFAAYCAHGLLPITTITNYQAQDLDGLYAGQHYYLAEQIGENFNLLEAQSIVNRVYDWYQDHNLSAQSKIFATYLLNNDYNLK